MYINFPDLMLIEDVYTCIYAHVMDIYTLPQYVMGTCVCMCMHARLRAHAYAQLYQPNIMPPICSPCVDYSYVRLLNEWILISDLFF